MKSELKSIVKADEPFLFQVYISTRQQEAESWGWSSEQIESFLSMQWQAQRLYYSQQFPKANHNIILYENEYVGRCVIVDLPEHLHLIDISVLPNYQGKGIGACILKLLQHKASKGGKPVTLQVFYGNSAMFLYERLGFQVVETNGLYVKMQWQEIQ